MAATHESQVQEGAVDTAKAVANYFLTKGFEEGVEIDHLKLQKLVYYSHAWHLANGMGPLFPDDIEAWPHGPVVRDLYVEFTGFGRKPINRLAQDWDDVPKIDGAPPSTANLLDAVWKTLRHYSGIQLSNSTHAAGEPWTIVREKYGSLDLKPRIPNSLIERCFRKKIDEPGAAAAS